MTSAYKVRKARAKDALMTQLERAVRDHLRTKGLMAAMERDRLLWPLMWCAAPAPTVRLTPVGVWIPKGFRTKFTHSLDPDASIWVVEATPSGYEGGEPVEQDSMWNTRFRIKRAQALIEMTPATETGKYDPIFRDDIKNLVNVERSGASAAVITEADYDGSTRAYYGYLRSVTFSALVENQAGTATATYQPTCWDPINNVEAGPVFANVTGS